MTQEVISPVQNFEASHVQKQPLIEKKLYFSKPLKTILTMEVKMPQMNQALLVMDRSIMSV